MAQRRTTKDKSRIPGRYEAAVAAGFKNREDAGKRRAFITGIAGQDGSYLAQFLMEKGYRVDGLVRADDARSIENLLLAFPQGRPSYHLGLHVGDVADGKRMSDLMDECQPDEVYNLASVSHVPDSWVAPERAFTTNALGALSVFRAVHTNCPHAKVYQASSSEQFAATSSGEPIDEMGAMVPRSPYGVSKLAAHMLAGIFRSSYGLFVSCGIAFNHESPRRDERFLSRKIAIGVAAMASGQSKSLFLGNMKAVRDWGYAPDYVKAMWLMLQEEEPGDLVLATGIGHTVRDFYMLACQAAGLKDGAKRLQLDPAFNRAGDPLVHIGNAELARSVIRWQPSVQFRTLVERMVGYEMARLQPYPVGHKRRKR
jgi:GDPmannose 4,6-dehydratase